MKRVNLDPDLEKRKAQIMADFHQGNEADEDAPSCREPSRNETPPVTDENLREHIIDALKTVYDPEIPVNIYDLGLIYKVDINDEKFVNIDMTLTAPGCPVAETFPGMVEQSVAIVPGVSGAAVELVWDPPWTPDCISEAAKLELGLL